MPGPFDHLIAAQRKTTAQAAPDPEQQATEAGPFDHLIAQAQAPANSNPRVPIGEAAPLVFNGTTGEAFTGGLPTVNGAPDYSAAFTGPGERSVRQVVDDTGLAIRQGTRGVIGGLAGLPTDLANLLLDPIPARLARSGMEAVGLKAPPSMTEAVTGRPVLPQVQEVRDLRAGLTEANARDAATWQSPALGELLDIAEHSDTVDTAGLYLLRPELLAHEAAKQIPQLAVAAPGSTAGTVALQALTAGAQNEAQVAETVAQKVARGQMTQEQADAAGSNAFAASSALNAALPAIPGAQVLERVMAGQGADVAEGAAVRHILTALLGEGAQGALSEGGDQAIANAASGDPLGQGVGKAALLGTVLEGPLGGAGGAVEALASRGTRQSAAPPAAPPQPAPTVDPLTAAIRTALADPPAAAAPAAAAAPGPQAPVDDDLAALLQGAGLTPDQVGNAFADLIPQPADTAPAKSAQAPAAGSAPPPPGAASDGVPFMVTRQMKADLRARGYDDAAIAKMRPADAHAVLAEPAVSRGTPEGAPDAPTDPAPADRRDSPRPAAPAAAVPAAGASAPDLAPDAALGAYLDPEGRPPERPAPKADRDQVLAMRSEIGWLEKGGRLLRASADLRSDQADARNGLDPADTRAGDVIGRTTWQAPPAPDGGESHFWRQRPVQGWTPAAFNAALDAFEAGQPLTRQQRRMVAYAQQAADTYAEAEAEQRAELEAFDEVTRQREFQGLRQDIGEALDQADRDEALSLYQLVTRAIGAGYAIDGPELAQPDGESDRAYAARLHSLLKEPRRAADPEPTRQDQAASRAGRGQQPQPAGLGDLLGDAPGAAQQPAAAAREPERAAPPARAADEEVAGPREGVGYKGRTTSWVLRNKTTGEVIAETTDRKKVDALNTAKYEAVPVQQHLAEISQPGTLAYRNARGEKIAPAPAETRPTSAGLFGAPTARDVVDDAQRRKDAARDGKTGSGRTDMAAGAGELFAGRRPQQVTIEDAPKPPAKSLRQVQRSLESMGQGGSYPVNRVPWVKLGFGPDAKFSDGERLKSAAELAQLIEETRNPTDVAFKVVSDPSALPPPDTGLESTETPQTQTAAFKRWFGDSKVVDANGAPLVVYHGSPDARFMQGDATFMSMHDRYGAREGKGVFWFSASPRTAKTYADDRRAFDYQNAEPDVIPAYLSLQNPLVIDAKGQDWITAQSRGRTSNVIAQAQADGHDGVIVRNVVDDYQNGGGRRPAPTDTYTVFDSRQIKSATANRGAFDPASPSILESTDTPFYSAALRAIEQGKGAPKKADATAWGQWLDGAVRRGEMKQAERDWLGIDAWLAEQGTVTRDQLADFVRAHQVQVQDVVLGDPDHVWEYRGEGRFERGDVVLQQRRDGSVLATDPFGEVEFATVEDAKDHYRTSSVAEERPTKFASYQLPGGANYRELLLTLPTEDSGKSARLAELAERDRQRPLSAEDQAELAALRADAKGRSTFKSSHFDQPNILAHVRFNERTDADGQKVLFLEEIQSDWHQAGRKRGYAKPIKPGPGGLPEGWTVATKTIPQPPFGDVTLHYVADENGDRKTVNHDTPEAAIAEWDGTGDQRQANGDRVPDAPFKATDEWALLAFKRMVRWAAENGFDRIAWTTGAQQAERYDLSKQVEYLTVMRNKDGTYDVRVQALNGGSQTHRNVTDLEPLIGKEMAQRAIERNDVADAARKAYREELRKPGESPELDRLGRLKDEAELALQIDGEGLKLGGEGMAAFYDRILPQAVNRWAKRFGARVEPVDLGERPHEFTGRDGQVQRFPTRAQAQQAANVDQPVRPSEGGATLQHGITLTDAMRDAALGGQPLFNREDVGLGADLLEADTAAIKAAVDAHLGPVAEKVIYLRSWRELPERLRKGVESRLAQRGGVGQTAALFDPETQDVYLFTDTVPSPARAVWHVAHEIAGHQGLRALLGSKLDPLLDLALQNSTVKAVADAIARERNIDTRTQRGRMLAAEEALAELAAATRTGDWSQIERRYQVEVPEGMRAKVTAAIRTFLAKLKVLFERVFDNPRFTDTDVAELLEHAWQAAQGNVVGDAGEALEQAAFHGTPHTVDGRFSLQKIGTGEGAQAYGWGLYFASLRDVAESYRQTLASTRLSGVNGAAYGTDQEAAEADARRLLIMQRDNPREFAQYDEGGRPSSYIGKLVRDIKRGTIKAAAGNTYRVEIPENEDLLDYDKPLAQQSPKVIAALERLPDGPAVRDALQWFERSSTTGASLYRSLVADVGSPARASEELQRVGIPGMRYLDGASRSAGEGSHNYVIWDEAAIGEPQALDNVERFETAADVLKAGRLLSVIDAAKAQGLDLGPLQKAHAANRASEFLAALDGLLAKLNKSPENAPAPKPTTGLANAITDAERREAGRDPILRDAVVSNPSVVAQALRDLREDPKAGEEAVARITRGGDVSLADEGILLVYKTRLMNERRAAADVLGDPAASEDRKAVAQKDYDESEAKIAAVDLAASAIGTEAGRLLQFRRRQMAADFTLEAMESKERARLKRPLTVAESVKLKAMAQTIADLQKKLDAVQARVANAASESVLAEVVQEVQSPRLTAAREGLRQAANDARARLRRVNLAQTNIGVDPRTFADLALIGADHIANGVEKFGDWVAAMKADVGAAFDAWKAEHPNLFQAAKKKAAEPDKPARAVKAAKTPDEVRAGMDPATVTPKDVRALVKAHVQQGLRGEPTVMQQVADELGLPLDEVRALFVASSPKAPRTLDEVQAELRDLRKLVRLENEIARLQAGEPKVPKRPGEPDSPAVAAKKAELAALRERMKPPRDPEGRYQALRGAQIRARIQDLQDRIARGDFAARPRIPRALNAANEAAQFELDKAKEAFLRAQFLDQLAKRSRLGKVLGNVGDALNLSRALMTSLDFSALLRQGGFISYGHPVRALKAVPTMLRAMATDQGHKAAEAAILARPNAPLYKRAGLQLTGIGAGPLQQIEENYASRWLESLPTWTGAGLVRGSARAYTGFLNQLRADSFDAMAGSLSRTGTPTAEEAKAIAHYINVATGRGTLPGKGGADAGQLLNKVFFAPRLVASRFQLLGGTPLWDGSARTRALIAQDYARFLAGVGVAMSLAAFGLADDDEDPRDVIGLDPRSANFLRLKFGDTVLDPMTGLAQVLTFVSRVASGETVTGKGAVKPLRPGGTWTDLRRQFDPSIPAHKLDKDGSLGFGARDARDVIFDFADSKFAPVAGAALNLAAGQRQGERVTPAQVAGQMVTPMGFADVAAVMEEQGVPKAAAMTLLGMLGMGLQHRGRTPAEKLSDLTAATDAAKAEISERLVKLPPEQWEAEMAKMHAKYGPLLDGIRLDTYADNADNERKDRVGKPKTRDGKPVFESKREADDYRGNIDAADDEAVHHLIPDHLVRHHPLMAQARKLGYDLDRASNLVALPKEPAAGRKLAHKGSHPNYDAQVMDALEAAQRRLKREHGSLDQAPKAEVLDAVDRIEAALRKKIEAREVPQDKGRLSRLNPGPERRA